ncbi:MAG: HD domain-containing protein [Spirochaetes bacterium]|nr:HD domain-containing protein [Spirochaetota bacterium]
MRKLIRQYAKDLTSGRLASGYEHSYRVYKLARKIGESIEYDDEILHAACFLHDVEMAVGHPKSSAEKARIILNETGFAPNKILKVYDAIINHMPGGNPSENAEGKLLYDANLLESIGAIGFSRLSIGAFFWHHVKTMDEVLTNLKQWLSYSDSFYFEQSRVLAKSKREFLKTAIKQFEEELSF